MQIRRLTHTQLPPLRQDLPKPSKQVNLDEFVPSTELAIEERAEQLEAVWAKRVPNPKSTVGILCERSWKPDSPNNAVMQIADAIIDAGGIPKVLYIGEMSPSDQMVGLDALAIPGGRDVHPKFYGQTMGPGMANSKPDPDFDEFEIECIQSAFASGMPMLGHCRGEQIMNVAAGGTLIQDLPTEFESPENHGSKYGTKINHRPPDNSTDEGRVNPVHFLLVAEDSRLHEIVGDSLEAVNSIHHQAIAQVAPILTAVAWAPDGVVEGVERKGMPWQSAYQFHPEHLRSSDSAYQKLYENLVNDGEKFRNGELTPTAA